MAQLRNLLARWLGLKKEVVHPPIPPHRGAQDHVVILDGTRSSLAEGMRSNAGLLYRLLCRLPARDRPNLLYESGVQWISWRHTRDVIEGRGINRQICRAYGFVASRYHENDRLFLFGYSRGAFAVRSLAGFIDQVGLLKANHATERNIRQAYRLYQGPAETQAIQAFRDAFCHPKAEIEMVGVWDTVKALGLPLPLLWRLTDHRHAFHSAHLGPTIRNGFHALALDETRQAFQPVLWKSTPHWQGQVEQMWFRGRHADVGGQLGGFEAARPLSNIPLVWMLQKANALDLKLPEGWQEAFPCDVNAPSVASKYHWGQVFVSRWKRKVGQDPSEQIHASVPPDHPQVQSLRQTATTTAKN